MPLSKALDNGGLREGPAHRCGITKDQAIWLLDKHSRLIILDSCYNHEYREGADLRFGYSRVSTSEQSLELQTQALEKAACDRIFSDKMSGTRSDRPGLQEAMSHLREGDTLVVWKLDRLGRSVKGLVDLVTELEIGKIHFASITDQIDTSTPAGRFFFHVMASLAQMEKEQLVERTQAGLQAARRLGRVGGRKRKMDVGKVEAAKRLLATGVLPKEVASNLGVSVPTLYRWLPAGNRE